ncbi:MAG: hypothetical protein ACFFAS_07890 [Promethearchaeota archaeon]
MGKKPTSIGIKTARYFTKKCSKCNTEYPNWFTNCPKCGTAWDEIKAKTTEKSEEYKKNVKIVVKITEEDFNQEILDVKLVFSADQGKSWYQMKMTNEIDHYMAKLSKVPNNSVIIYYIELYLANGEKIVENNDEKYYYYRVGVAKEETKEEPPEAYYEKMKENIDSMTASPQDYYDIPPEDLSEGERTSLLQKNLTIFGKPQVAMDSSLKICSNCNSKIKKMWTTCPICGKEI